MFIAFIILAAFFKAICDSVENEHVYDTKFRNLNANFWHKRISWNKAKNIFGWKADAWHIANSLMIISFSLAVVLYQSLFGWLYDFLIAGAAWNLPFNFFYWLFKK